MNEKLMALKAKYPSVWLMGNDGTNKWGLRVARPRYRNTLNFIADSPEEVVEAAYFELIAKKEKPICTQDDPS